MKKKVSKEESRGRFVRVLIELSATFMARGNRSDLELYHDQARDIVVGATEEAVRIQTAELAAAPKGKRRKMAKKLMSLTEMRRALDDIPPRKPN